MADFGSGSGGSANTPPFPRVTPNEPSPEPSAGQAHASGPISDNQAPGAPERATSDDWEPDLDVGGEIDDETPLPPRGRGRRRLPPLASADFRRYAERTVARGCERIADRLDYAADRIALIARNRPGGSIEGLHGPTSPVGWMQGTARYLRESDLPTMQSDLEGRVREKPLQTLLLTLSAGWLLGRILR